MKLMEVRGGSQLETLLGYLPAPSGKEKQASFGEVTLEVHAFTPTFTDGPIGGRFATAAELHRALRGRGLAYKADGLTLEELQKIPGFLTAAPEQQHGLVEHVARRARSLS